MGVGCSAVDSSEESDDESIFGAATVAANVVRSDTASLKSVLLSEPQDFSRSDTMSAASEGSNTPERPVPGEEKMDPWHVDEVTWEKWERLMT